jgi:hypothetical protein
MYVAGYRPGVLIQMMRWTTHLLMVARLADPPIPGPKTFTPKFELPVLKCYRSEAPEEYWEKFPCKPLVEGKSLINATKLRSLAAAVGCGDFARLEAVCKDLSQGADIGCEGEFRMSSFSTNAPSAYEYPIQVSDAIAQWVSKGFAVGPIAKERVPEGIKVNGIMCRPKPNGSVRIILNLSAPEGRAVNDGIDSGKFPATMSSTSRWLAVLYRAGRGCKITKLDWSDAYKHIHVRKEDVKLQWFQWAGKYFAELCLVFGAASSPGIYDRAAKTVLDLVLRMAQFPAELVCQHLDDVCAAAAAGSMKLEEFERTYREVAEDIGVKLAPYGDPDKAFAPCTKGIVLGVEYDTEKWTWAIPQEKLARLVAQIRKAMEAETMKQEELWSLAGRIIHYAPLIPGGKYNIRHIIRANAASTDRNFRVPVTTELKRQLYYWMIVIRTNSGHAGIPRPELFLPAWATEFHTDAAGGTLDSVGRGCGGVSGGWWFYIPWPRKINCGVKAVDGKKLSRKLSALELVGPLVCVAAAADKCRDQPVRIWVDNSGSVRIWEKGYSSSCDLCSTLVTAIATVAAAIGCRLSIEKITRCSTREAEMADALSKAEFARCRALGTGTGSQLQTEPAWVPRSILWWLNNPVPDDDLGKKILVELANTSPVLGYNC